MENPHQNMISSLPTDYGSTTLTASTSTINTVQSEGDYEQITATRYSSNTVSSTIGYQSLPPYLEASTTNRFVKGQKSSSSFVMISSRFANMSTEGKSTSRPRQCLERLETYAYILNQILIGFVTIYMSWLCLRTGLAGTGLHAWLVTIGFVFLMAEAIMCHYSANVLLNGYKRTTKTTVHWVLQVFGGGCGVAGILIKCFQKGFLLKSTHGKLGFAALILCLISMLGGLGALYSMRFKKLLSPLLNKTLHNLLGIAAFVIAMLAQFYGYQTGYFSRKVDNDFQILIKCITLVALVLTCIGPLKAIQQKLCSIVTNFR